MILLLIILKIEENFIFDKAETFKIYLKSDKPITIMKYSSYETIINHIEDTILNNQDHIKKLLNKSNKINTLNTKFDKINELIDIIISDEYNKIYKTFFPIKNIHSEIIDIPLKKNSYIIFEYAFNSEKIDIPLIVKLKIDGILEKNFNIVLKEYNKITYTFKLDYNVTKIKFDLYLLNDEKILFNNKKLNSIYFLIYKYMNYYRKTVNKVVNDVKLKMQLAAITLKLNENNKKIDDLIGVDKNIKKDILNNLGKIDTNTSNIDEINSNLSNVDFNSGNKFSIENFFIYNIEIENSYKLNKDKRNFSIFRYTLEDNFKKDSILEIDCRLLYRYNNYNHIGLLQHIFKLYDDNNNMFYEYKSLKTNAGDNTRNDIKQNDFFYTKLDNDYKIIKIELILSLIDDVSNTTSVDCRLYNKYKSNFLNIKYYKKTNLISVNNNLRNLENTILNNKNDISTNLIKINSNEDDILSNSSEIDNIKNDISKSYLKNIYNISFYNNKTQINFKGIFFEKVFQVNASIDDFIEIDLKMLLEYDNINEKIYVNTIYEILDENSNSLYISTVNNNDYQYFSNKVSIKENILYNSTKNVKNIKFRIKFVMTTARVIKIWYINNNNYRFIFKHYST